MREHDVAAAQAVIGRHVLPEWRASDEAPHVFEAMARDIADALEAASGGTSGSGHR